MDASNTQQWQQRSDEWIKMTEVSQRKKAEAKALRKRHALARLLLKSP